jgi:hypothetical protein
MRRNVKEIYAKYDEATDVLLCTMKEFNQSFPSSGLNPNKKHEVHKEENDKVYSEYVSTLQRFTIPRFIIDIITLGLFSQYIYR